MRFLLLLLCCLFQPAFALERFPDFYAGIVPAEGKTPQVEEIERALEQVFIRLSGQRDVRAIPELQEAFERAPGLMQSFVYVTAGRDLPAHFEIEFDNRILHSYLELANLSIWGEERPRILILDALRDGLGRIQLSLDGAESSDAVDGLKKQLRQNQIERGIIWQLPLGRWEDYKAVREMESGGEVAQSIEDLKQAYGADGVFLVLAEQIGKDRYSVIWRLFSELSGRIPAPSAREVLPQVLDEVASVHAETNFDLGSATEEVLLIVEGVRHFGDLYSLAGILQGIFPDQSIIPLGLEGSRVEFVVTAQRGLRNLRRQIAAQPYLESIRRPSTPGRRLQVFFRLDAP